MITKSYYHIYISSLQTRTFGYMMIPVLYINVESIGSFFTIDPDTVHVGAKSLIMTFHWPANYKL